MRSPRWRKVLRDIWLHKSRTSLAVLAIVVGIVGAGSVLDTWALLRRVVDDGYRATNPVSATLRTDSVDSALLDMVAAMPAVREVQARRVLGASALVAGAWRPVMLFAMDDFRALRIGLVETISGEWPPADGGIVIERSSLELAGAGVGDSLLVRVGDGEAVRLGINGVARDAGLAPGWMEHLIYAFVTPATLERMGVSGAMDRVQFVVRDAGASRDEVRRIAFDVKAVIEGTGRMVTDIAVPEPGRHIHADQMNSLLYTQAAFGVLALLLSGVLVVNLVAAMLAGQVREIGVMKAIGARNGQIAGMYLALALVLGIVASAIAIPIASLLGQKYAEFSAGMLNFDASGFGVPLWVMAVQLAVGALLPVAAASIPVSRGCRIHVSEALRDFGMGRDVRRDAPSFARVSGLGRPVLLSLRNAFRRRQRMVLTLLTLAMGGAVFLAALNLRASIREAVASMFSAMRYDLTLSLAQRYPAAEVLAAVRAVPGVSAAEATSGGSAAALKADGTFGDALSVAAVSPASTLLGYPIVEGRWLQPGDGNALVVSRRQMTEEPLLKVGSEVTLVIRGRTSRWMVVGAVAALAAPMVAPESAWAAASGEGGVNRVQVALAVTGAGSVAEVRQRLHDAVARAGFDVSGSSMVAEARAVTEDHVLMVAGFLVLMSQLMIVVGGLGLASTMSLAVLERTREIGVLRAIGARHGAIHTIVQAEGLVIALAGWAVALPLSAPMSIALNRSFGAIMFRGPLVYVPEVSSVLQWLALVLVISVIACAWPAFRATRITAAQALAYE